MHEHNKKRAQAQERLQSMLLGLYSVYQFNRNRTGASPLTVTTVEEDQYEQKLTSDTAFG